MNEFIMFEEYKAISPTYLSMWIDSDYTGRWMIQDGDLFIECFDIKLVDVEKREQVYTETLVYDSIWDRIKSIPSRYIKEKSGVITWTEQKVKANVRWVPEEDLRVTYQYINECTGDCE